MALPRRVVSARAGKQTLGAGAAPGLCRAEKGEGLGVRTPSPLPAPALWADPHRWGWAKGRALRLLPCCSASSAAQLGARGLLGVPCAFWLGGVGRGRRDWRRRGVFPGIRSRLGLGIHSITVAPGASNWRRRSPPRSLGPRRPGLSAGLRVILPAGAGRVAEALRGAEGAETSGGGGAGWERSGTGGAQTKTPMAGGRSTVTSLLGQSTDLTAPQREDIR
jgi:hypothetical protein